MKIVPIRNIVMAAHPIQTAEQLSTHLRSLRRRLKLTQAELGVRLGVEQARVAKIERNPVLQPIDLGDLRAPRNFGYVLACAQPEDVSLYCPVHCRAGSSEISGA